MVFLCLGPLAVLSLTPFLVGRVPLLKSTTEKEKRYQLILTTLLQHPVGFSPEKPLPQHVDIESTAVARTDLDTSKMLDIDPAVAGKLVGVCGPLGASIMGCFRWPKGRMPPWTMTG